MKWVLALLLLLLPLAAIAADDSNELIRRGDDLLKQKQYRAAHKAYSEANKSLGGKCSRCFLGMGYAKALNGEDKDALKLIDKAVETASTPAERAEAHTTKGDVLMMFWKAQPKYVPQAEAEFRAALVDAPQKQMLHARLGLALGRQNKDAEAISELKIFVEAVPTGASSEQVRTWMEDPRRMRATQAPEFSIKSSTGEEIKMSALAGKVVVLDFWATWCPPCVESVDELKELRKKYAADKLVVISLSADRDQQKWQEFIVKRKMDWPQFYDGDSKIQDLYGVNSFPTYIVIDTEGFIQQRLSGLDPNETLAGRLKKQLKEILPD